MRRNPERIEESLRGLSVLVVEDEFLLLSELETVLREAGVGTVYACRTVPEAYSSLDKREIAAAILDVRIGHDSVAPVARRLAKRKTPFLFYTGQTAKDPVMLEWPACPILSKPAPSHRVISALRDLLKQDLLQQCGA